MGQRVFVTDQRWARIALGYLAAVSLLIGVWAQFAPRSFYDDFPGLGRHWVRIDGPFNEHLVRDVGGLNLGIAVVLIAAMITMLRPMIVTAALASLAYGIPHLVYHIFKTDSLDTGDAFMSIGGLALFAALPILLILSSSSSRVEAE
jgi:hypothetical protein